MSTKDENTKAYGSWNSRMVRFDSIHMLFFSSKKAKQVLPVLVKFSVR
jgi:hypothetical protein